MSELNKLLEQQLSLQTQITDLQDQLNQVNKKIKSCVLDELKSRLLTEAKQGIHYLINTKTFYGDDLNKLKEKFKLISADVTYYYESDIVSMDAIREGRYKISFLEYDINNKPDNSDVQFHLPNIEGNMPDCFDEDEWDCDHKTGFWAKRKVVDDASYWAILG